MGWEAVFSENVSGHVAEPTPFCTQQTEIGAGYGKSFVPALWTWQVDPNFLWWPIAKILMAMCPRDDAGGIGTSEKARNNAPAF